MFQRRLKDRHLKRRHLNESQRAMVAAKLANLSEGRPSKTSPIGGVSQSSAAEMLNVGKRSVERAMVAAKLATMKHGGDRGANQYGERQGANLPDATTNSEAAKLLNVSERTVATAAKVASISRSLHVREDSQSISS